VDEHAAGLAFAYASESLSDLLERARQMLRDIGSQHVTQRGVTRSANRVILTWKAPHLRDKNVPGSSDGLRWTREDVEWYLRVFVERNEETDPLREVERGRLLFPYTYAARSRYWDAGWAVFYRMVSTLKALDMSLEEVAVSAKMFGTMVAQLAEHVHLQTVLSLLALYPPATLRTYLHDPTLVLATAHAWQRDMLDAAIKDVAGNPHSRRAVVGAFSYPHLEEALQPQMGKPPYQLFQLLPDDADAPLSSIHEHRSLDVYGGAPLDFYHDLAWLNEACQRLGRPLGDITVVAHNLHEYESLDANEVSVSHQEAAGVERWLCQVTDGYRSGIGIPTLLLHEPAYAENLRRIQAHWQRDMSSI
jgi:hypothetical protein